MAHMRYYLTGWMLLIGLACVPMAARADLWCSGYYPGWVQGGMPASNVDFSVVTHVIHFSVLPNPNGTLDTTANGLTPAFTADVVTRAHAAGRKAIICVGGAGTSFESAASNAYVGTFVKQLTNFMATSGYDGIDVDWEPLPDADAMLFTNFVTRLRSALDAFPTHKLLTIAVPTDATVSILSSVQSKFDQINLMTYDLSGPWDGWVTWYNSAVYDKGFKFISAPSRYLPCVDLEVTNFLAGGIQTNRLGIGIPFYGDVWQGGTGTSTGGSTQPYQSWSSAPTVNTVSYTDLMSSNFAAALYHYDTGAQAAYFSVTNAGNPAQDMFISFEDARACQAKVSYARNRGLGGFIIWELSQDHQAGKADVLLQAIKQTLQTPGALSIQNTNQGLNLNFTGAPLGAYQVQWSSNFSTWNTLLATNVSLSWTGRTIEATDNASQPQRFYRVKTP